MAIEALKKSETKQSLEAKKIQAYKEYFESTSKYFDEMNYIQLDSLQYHQKMLDDLLKENKEFKLTSRRTLPSAESRLRSAQTSALRRWGLRPRTSRTTTLTSP